MKRYLVKTPKLVQWLFPQRVWAFSRKEPNVYLTFDDGPIPEVTPWVLDKLKKHHAKATFFCIGDNVRKHPEVFQRIIAEGHAIGNHTYHHLNGSNTKLEAYLEDTENFETTIEHKISKSKIQNRKSNIVKLFRPPYGRLTQKQAKSISEKGYKIIMWDVLSADFDEHLSKEKCLENVIRNIERGSVVVFHDSLKAEEKLRFVLPKVLEYTKKQEWKCSAI